MLRQLGCLLLLIASILPTPGESKSPVTSPLFTCLPLDITSDLLSGLALYEDGVVVCDRGAGTVLYLQKDREPAILYDRLETPVDIMLISQEWFILQEEPGTIISIHPQTRERTLVVENLEHPTAFTFDNQENFFILQFDTGELIKFNTNTRSKEVLPIFLDKPADILFSPPNRLYVADQFGIDGSGGLIYELDLHGTILSTFDTVIDPSGLAMNQKQQLFSTSFQIHRHPNVLGGIVDVSKKNMAKIVIDDLIAPTILLITPSNDFIVLDEPVDSVYMYSSKNTKTRLLDGFGHVIQAAKFSNGNIAAIEMERQSRLRIKDHSHIRTIQDIQTHTLLPVMMVNDQNNNLYLFEALGNSFSLFDPEGEVIGNVSGLNPILLIGNEKSPAYAISRKQNHITLSSLPSTTQTVPLDIQDPPMAGTVSSAGTIVLAYENGAVHQFSQNGKRTETLFPQSSYRIRSLIQDDTNSLWFLDENSNSIYLRQPDQTVLLVSTNCSGGTLLPHGKGIFYINEHGKQFVIFKNDTSIHDWMSFQ